MTNDSQTTLSADLQSILDKHRKFNPENWNGMIAEILVAFGKSIADLQQQNLAIRTRLDAIARPVLATHRPYDREPAGGDRA